MTKDIHSIFGLMDPYTIYTCPNHVFILAHALYLSLFVLFRANQLSPKPFFFFLRKNCPQNLSEEKGKERKKVIRKAFSHFQTNSGLEFRQKTVLTNITLVTYGQELILFGSLNCR